MTLMCFLHGPISRISISCFNFPSSGGFSATAVAAPSPSGVVAISAVVSVAASVLFSGAVSEVGVVVSSAIVVAPSELGQWRVKNLPVVHCRSKETKNREVTGGGSLYSHQHSATPRTVDLLF